MLGPSYLDLRPLAPAKSPAGSPAPQVTLPEVTALAKAYLMLKSDATHCFFDLTVEMFENDDLIATRHWESVTPACCSSPHSPTGATR